MKKNLLTLLVLSLPSLAFTQVSLNASMAPPVNSMFIYYDANVPSPPFTFGKTGTSNTWDFTSVAAVPGADDTTFIVDPALVPVASAFPAATHLTRDDGDVGFTVMEINASGVTFLGSISDLTGSGNLMALTAVPPLQAMSFPYAYGATATGSAYFTLTTSGASVGQPTMDSVRYKSTINAQRDVIAAGSIILPAGTFDAMLERGINNSIDSLWVKGSLTLGQWVLAPGFPQTSTDSSFQWYTNNSLQPYAHALYDDTGTLHDVNYYKSTTSVGIKEVTEEKTQSAYPNPVRNILNVKGFENADYNFEILTVSGQTVAKGQTSVGMINVSWLQPGIYMLKAYDEKNVSSVIRFVKE